MQKKTTDVSYIYICKYQLDFRLLRLRKKIRYILYLFLSTLGLTLHAYTLVFLVKKKRLEHIDIVCQIS